MNIRQMKTEDYDAVVAIWRTSELDFCPEGRESREAVARQIAEFPELTLVAEENGALAGVVLGTHDGRKGWINRLAVAPDFRRRGVARLLLERLHEEYDRLGFVVVAALVKEHNTASQALCESLGYSVMHEIKYYSRRKKDDYCC